MQNNIPSNRKWVALLLLPGVLLPLLTLGFWALGGGRATPVKSQTPSGLNLELPNAFLKKEGAATKLGFYEQAEADSVKRSAQLRSDPGYWLAFTRDTAPEREPNPVHRYDPARPYADSSEEKVRRKLAALQQQLQETTAFTTKQAALEPTNSPPEQDRILPGNAFEESLPPAKTPDEKNRDPELEQLDGLMDKIIAIQQQPGATAHARQTPSRNTDAYPVQKAARQQHVSLLDTVGNGPYDAPGFYGWDRDTEPAGPIAIEAIVHQTQTLTDGDRIKLRLEDAMSIGGTILPRGTFLFGIASLSGQRLQVTIGSVRYRNVLFPVKLEGYDLDGQRGLYITGPAVKKSTDALAANASPMLQFTDLVPTQKAQAATAGLRALQSVLTKRVKPDRVTVQAGYRLFLQQSLITP